MDTSVNPSVRKAAKAYAAAIVEAHPSVKTKVVLEDYRGHDVYVEVGMPWEMEPDESIALQQDAVRITHKIAEQTGVYVLGLVEYQRKALRHG